jgi:hypothetical protein
MPRKQMTSFYHWFLFNDFCIWVFTSLFFKTILWYFFFNYWKKFNLVGRWNERSWHGKRVSVKPCL